MKDGNTIIFNDIKYAKQLGIELGKPYKVVSIGESEFNVAEITPLATTSLRHTTDCTG